MRAAGDQGHVDVVPVLPAGVLEDGPTLQQAVTRTRHQPVARLPQRHLGQVAQRHATTGWHVQRDLQLPLLLAAAIRQPRQHQPDLALERRIAERDPVDGLEHHRADPVGTHQAEPVRGGRAVAVQCLLGGHGQDPAAQRGWPMDLDLGTTQAQQQGRQVAQIGFAERHVAKQVGQRRRPQEAHRPDRAAIAQDGQALEDVVDLAQRHGQAQPAIGRDRGPVAQIADPARGQEHALQHRLGSPGARGGPGLGQRQQQRGQQDTGASHGWSWAPPIADSVQGWQTCYTSAARVSPVTRT